MRIWKFSIPVHDHALAPMPADARILSAGAQDPSGRTIQIWAEVNPDALTVPRRFAIAGTGHFPPRGDFVATVFSPRGGLVWHVYDMGEAA